MSCRIAMGRVVLSSCCRRRFYIPVCYQHSYQTLSFKNDRKAGNHSVNGKFLSPVFVNALKHLDKIALKDTHGQYTYGGLLSASEKLALSFIQKIGDETQQRVAFLCPNDASYIITQWACWISGNIAVPLSRLHPSDMLEYFVRDSESNLIVSTPEYLNVIGQVITKTGGMHIIFDDAIRKEAAVPVDCENKENSHNILDNALGITNFDRRAQPSKLNTNQNFESLVNSHKKIYADGGIFRFNEDFYKKSGALIIYTSGTTGQPKGALITHKNLDAQMKSLIKAWKWTSNDSILHSLPLHHVHGIINALLCPLAVGARCVMLPSFDASEIWKQFLGVKLPECERINMFMGVPTMYVKLIDKYIQSLTKNERMIDYVRAECSQKLRLFVSGSAPLPTQLFEKWEYITGHLILERYGMTETGMILSNPLYGIRKPGSVGKPLPGVNVRIVDSDGTSLVEGSSSGTRIISKHVKNLSGELQVKSDNVFSGYYKRPQQTEESFDDNWFKTGDYVQYEENNYQILGRQSVDIIKTGGYKVSALHVETALRDHPDITDVAVVGLSDETWGQTVAAVVETTKGDKFDPLKVKEWVKTKLPSYEVPTIIRTIKTIPRNQLGKVDKKGLINVVFQEKK